MAILNRTSIPFLRRNGVMETPRSPRPRFDARFALVNQLPLTDEQLDPHQMLDANGEPATDRGPTDVWPPPQEVRSIP